VARGHRLEGRANHLGVRGEPGVVVRGFRAIVPLDAIRQLEHQKFAEQVGTIGFSPVIFDARFRVASPGQGLRTTFPWVFWGFHEKCKIFM